jgi:hypothetical protein
MKRFLFFLLLLGLAFGTSFQLKAQRWKFLRYELVGGLGSTNIIGDVGGAPTTSNLFGIRDFRVDQTRPSIDLGVRYRLYETQVIRFNINYGYGYGTDKGSINSERNYSYTTNLFEQSVVYEYYLISEEQKRKSVSIYNKRGMLNNFSKVSLFVFAGAGLTESFTKKDQSFGERPIDLYFKNGLTLCLPFGVGLKYIFDERLGAGIEFGGRYCFNDKLDGLSTAYSHNNDLYYLGSLHLSYRLKTSRNGLPTFIADWKKNRAANQRGWGRK